MMSRFRGVGVAVSPLIAIPFVLIAAFVIKAADSIPQSYSTATTLTPHCTADSTSCDGHYIVREFGPVVRNVKRIRKVRPVEAGSYEDCYVEPGEVDRLIKEGAKFVYGPNEELEFQSRHRKYNGVCGNTG